MIRAVVVGQSHCVAIAKALANGAGGSDVIEVYRVGAVPGMDEKPFNFGDAIGVVADLPDGVPLFVSVLGGYHNQLGLLESGTPFDFPLDPADVGDASGSTVLVPHRAVSSIFTQIFEEAGKLRTLARTAKGHVYALGTPAPKQDNVFIKSIMMRQRKKVYNGRNFVDVDIERPETRLKLWRLETQLLEAWSIAEGMRFVPGPAEATDEVGFLRPEFYEDATHANARYGALVVDQIRTLCAGERGHG